MTFTEAAVEVLRLVGKPLHYKKITELAIERNMLSHVGKTPEVTMSSRLATMVKRDRGEAPIIKVKPGVFGLRDFNEEQLADLSGDIDELPEVEVENEETEAAEAAGAEAEGAEKVKPEPRKPLPGADVFPEEEDDDEPILGGNDEDEEDDDEEGEGKDGDKESAESRSSRRRKRKRRRGRGADEGEDRFEPRRNSSNNEPSSEGRRDERVEARRDDRGEGRREDGRNERSRDDRGNREERHRRDREERRERNDRGRDRSERDRSDRDQDRGREREEDYGDASREPNDGDLLGKDLADAVESVLGSSGPRGLPAYRVADQLVRRGRLSGDPNALVPTLMAAVRADIARKKIADERARFKVEGTTLILTDFLLPQDVIRAEQDVLRAAERQRDRVRRAYLRRLGELSPAGLAEVVATWLNAEGVVGLRAVRRPGANPGELHLAGTLRRGVEEQRIAIVVLRDVREIGRERVIEARGALHYYGNASSAWLVTLGQVLSGAREEGSAPAAASVTLFDGMALTAAMERVGVGLSVRYVAISALDFELLDALRGPVREERERDRNDRGRDERGRDERGRDERRDERGGRERDRDERSARDRDRDERGGRERDRNRDERSRDERGQGRDRYERDRPRPVDEAPEGEEEAESEEQELESQEGVESSEGAGDESAAHGENGPAENGEAQGEAREGGRRRRRRRRRKGGRDREENAGAAASAEGEEESEGDEEAEGPSESEEAQSAAREQGEISEDAEGVAQDADWGHTEGDDVAETGDDEDEEETELPSEGDDATREERDERSEES